MNSKKEKNRIRNLYGKFYWDKDFDNVYFVTTKTGNFILTLKSDDTKNNTIKRTELTLTTWTYNKNFHYSGSIMIKHFLDKFDFDLILPGVSL